MSIVRNAILSVVSLTVLGGLLSACGGGVNAPRPSGSSPTPTVEPPEAYTPSSIPQALLDGTTVEVQQDGTYSWTIIATLPTGNVAKTTYTVDPKGADLGAAQPSSVSGSPLRGFQTTHQDTADGLQWGYQYTLANGSFPAGALAAARGDGGARWVVRTARALLDPSPVYASGGGAQVVVNGVAQHFTDSGIGVLEKMAGTALDSEALKNGAASEFRNSFKDVVSAVDTRDSYQKIMKQLEDLRQCAENPTNPLTQQEYAQDPTAKQKVLDQIDSAETDIKSNTAVQFLNMLNAKATALTKSTLVGFIVGKVSSWVNPELAKLNQERLQEMEQLVTKCSPQWMGTVNYTIVATKTLPAKAPWTGQTIEKAKYDSEGTVLTGAGSLTGAGGEISGDFPLDTTVTGSKTYDSAMDWKVYGGCSGMPSQVLKTEQTTSDKWQVQGSAHGQTDFQIQINFDGTYTVTYGPLSLLMEGAETQSDYSLDTQVCFPSSSPIQDGPNVTTEPKQDGYDEPDVTASGKVDDLNNLTSLSGSKTFEWTDGFVEGTATLKWELHKGVPPPPGGPPPGPDPTPYRASWRAARGKARGED